jgi:hypothetical protein
MYYTIIIQNVSICAVQKIKFIHSFTYLSRAFDCLPPKLLISKLNAYGVDAKSCMMLANYFLGRKQRVKLAHTRSD